MMVNGKQKAASSNNTVMSSLVFSLVICAMLLGLCPSAEAQQAKKVGARIGYLSVLSPLLISDGSKPSAKVCANWATSMVRT